MAAQSATDCPPPGRWRVTARSAFGQRPVRAAPLEINPRSGQSRSSWQMPPNWRRVNASWHARGGSFRVIRVNFRHARGNQTFGIRPAAGKALRRRAVWSRRRPALSFRPSRTECAREGTTSVSDARNKGGRCPQQRMMNTRHGLRPACLRVHALSRPSAARLRSTTQRELGSSIAAVLSS